MDTDASLWNTSKVCDTNPADVRKLHLPSYGKLSETFEVKTGVRQGCILSPVIVIMVIY